MGWERTKRKAFTLILVKIGVDGVIKKPRQAWGLAVGFDLFPIQFCFRLLFDGLLEELSS